MTDAGGHDATASRLVDRRRQTDSDRRLVRAERPRVSVVIPTLNEVKNLPYVFARLPDDLYEVIVVDGRSTDGTRDVARSLRPDAQIIDQAGHRQGRCPADAASTRAAATSS